jgi:hypothetical protein
VSEDKCIPFSYCQGTSVQVFSTREIPCLLSIFFLLLRLSFGAAAAFVNFSIWFFFDRVFKVSIPKKKIKKKKKSKKHIEKT